jgi:hypothetical protein
LVRELRFVNGNKLQPERCGVFWRPLLLLSITKDSTRAANGRD